MYEQTYNMNNNLWYKPQTKIVNAREMYEKQYREFVNQLKNYGRQNLLNNYNQTSIWNNNLNKLKNWNVNSNFEMPLVNNQKYWGINDSFIKDYTNTIFANNNQQNYRMQYDNNLTAKQRELALKNNKKLFLHLDENLKENNGWKWWCNFDKGSSAVNKYSNLIEKYANQYNVNSDLIKAIMFTENACGHYYGVNDFMDYIGLSKSQMPMNIRGSIWSNFQGQKYDTFDPQQNIELGTRLIKQIYDSLDNPTPDRIGTLWNSAAKDNISSFGYRVGDAYATRPWIDRNAK